MNADGEEENISDYMLAEQLTNHNGFHSSNNPHELSNLRKSDKVPSY